MKILKKGKKLEKTERIIRHTCPECACFFEFRETEVRKSHSPSSGALYFNFNCPECSRDIYLPESSLTPKKTMFKKKLKLKIESFTKGSKYYKVCYAHYRVFPVWINLLTKSYGGDTTPCFSLNAAEALVAQLKSLEDIEAYKKETEKHYERVITL